MGFRLLVPVALACYAIGQNRSGRDPTLRASSGSHKWILTCRRSLSVHHWSFVQRARLYYPWLGAVGRTREAGVLERTPGLAVAISRSPLLVLFHHAALLQIEHH